MGSGISVCCSAKSSSEYHTKTRTKPKWSELPTLVLELILKKLAFNDIVRFKAVCSYWNSVAESYVSSPYYNQTPWLMLPSAKKGDVNTRRFLCLAEKRVYTRKNVFEGFPPDNWCVGSSHGWLVILDSGENPHLFNPISGDRIRLPSMLTRVHYQYNFHEKFSKEAVVKAVISTNPSRNKNFIVVVIYEKPAYLAFYRHGRDDNWIDIFNLDKAYCDIVFNNDLLYALATSDGSVEVWNFSTSLIPIKSIYFQPYLDSGISTWNYLVEAFGELLCVEREVGTHNNDSRRTTCFRVYKMNWAAQKWSKIECLGDLVLFLGANQSMSLSTREFPACEENSIYFADDRCFDMNSPYHFGNGYNIDLGVYSLKDKVVKPFYQIGNKRRIDRTPFWIVPNPW